MHQDGREEQEEKICQSPKIPISSLQRDSGQNEVFLVFPDPSLNLSSSPSSQ